MKIMIIMKILKFMIFEALGLSDDRSELLSAAQARNVQITCRGGVVLSNTLAGWSAASRGPDKIRVFTTIFKFFSKSDLITDIIL